MAKDCYQGVHVGFAYVGWRCCGEVRFITIFLTGLSVENMFCGDLLYLEGLSNPENGLVTVIASLSAED